MREKYESLIRVPPLYLYVMQEGTGTQYHVHASEPKHEGRPNTFQANGTLWKVGHDYLDTEIGDLCRLVEVISKSSFCDTRDAKDCPPKLVFEYARYRGIDGDQISVDPYSREFDEERFIERYTGDPSLGAPEPPW